MPPPDPRDASARPGRGARILVADDSAFVRATVTRILEEGGHKVVAAAADGAEAAAAAEVHRPDVVLMDLRMSPVDGFEAIRLILRNRPTRILVLSALSTEGSREAIRALQAGAVDFATKPDPTRLASFRAELLEKVEVVRSARLPPAAASPTAARRTADPPALRGLGVAAIGVSTGGPSTLLRLLAEVPANFPAPILVAQHMPQGWTRTLAEQLDRSVRLRVREAGETERLADGTVYIAAGGAHLVLSGPREARAARDPGARYTPSADLLLRSVAEVYGRRGLGVILTGMGDDGLEGARAIRSAGGAVFAQDEASSIIYGMPRVVAEAGLAQWVAPPDEIGRHLAALAPPAPPPRPKAER